MSAMGLKVWKEKGKEEEQQHHKNIEALYERLKIKLGEQNSNDMAKVQ